MSCSYFCPKARDFAYWFLIICFFFVEEYSHNIFVRQKSMQRKSEFCIECSHLYQVFI